MGDKEHVLVVEDDPEMNFFLREAIKAWGYNVTAEISAEDAIKRMAQTEFDLIISDYRLPGEDGLELLKKVRNVYPDALVIMMTAYGSNDTGLEAIRRGAYDYFTKPVKLEELEVVVRRTLDKRAMQTEIRRLRAQLESATGRNAIIGNNGSMKEAFDLIDRVANTDTTILIHGETGTGKEVVSEYLHRSSSRAKRPFIKVNCAAIPRELLESELFGYEKGAFTGATGTKQGLFEQAHGGTLLLDEIGELDLSLQGKLLRLIETKEFTRLGGTETRKADVRLVAATNRDLRDEVKAARFREDLYFRLSVVEVTLPPLRERIHEIPELVQHFINESNVKLHKSIQTVAPDALQLLTRYKWSGNVRELRNYIERACILCDGSQIEASHLPPHVRNFNAPGVAAPLTNGGIQNLDDTMNQIQRQLVVEALVKNGGYQNLAAQALGITERSMWHLVKKHNINIEQLRRQQ